jgi:hypothetical protein
MEILTNTHFYASKCKNNNIQNNLSIGKMKVQEVPLQAAYDDF